MVLCTNYQQKYQHFYIIAKDVYKYINMLIIKCIDVLYINLITNYYKSYKHVLKQVCIGNILYNNNKR